MYDKAAQIIKSAKRCVAFTGAGMSVESGIPPFRGKGGLWNKYDPETFDISYFLSHTKESWEVIRTIFYDLFGKVKPNYGHKALAIMEEKGLLKAVITQNVDNLHYDAGNKIVHEFHGSLKKLVCLNCNKKFAISMISLDSIPPLCTSCKGILKPDVIFFGESIPEPARTNSFDEAYKADCFILIGTTGTVAPANAIPHAARANGAKIIEINPYPSEYTNSVTHVFLKDTAVTAMKKLMNELAVEFCNS